MFWYFLSATIMGLIVYTLGTYTVMVNLFAVAFKFIALAVILAALIFLYRKFRSRKRAVHHRRLLP